MDKLIFLGIIPARYQSTRFPGKPLAKIKNKPMIQWVYENVSEALENVCVATDDERIVEAVEAFGGKVVKTCPTHQSGTDRCAEAAKKLSESINFNVVINIQGDEPFVKPEQIELLKTCFKDNTEIATLVKRIEFKDELFNPNRPKVVLDNKQHATYFSRSPIPFVRDAKNENEWLSKATFWSHVGMYGFRADTLLKITQLAQGELEQAESLEQLRWLENGYKIKTVETQHQTIGIDTPKDLELANHFFKERL